MAPPHQGVHQYAAENHSAEGGLLLRLCTVNGGGSDARCQSDSPSPTDSELTQSQNMLMRARNANTCTKYQCIVVLLMAIQSYTVTHA